MAYGSERMQLKMKKELIFITVTLLGVQALIASGSISTLDDVINQQDKGRLSQLFEAAQPYDDIETGYLIVSGLEGIGFDDSNRQLRDNACKMATAKEYLELKEIFYATSVANIIGKGCKMDISKAGQEVITAALSSESMETLYYAVTSMANLKMDLDSKAVSAALITALENEDAPIDYARAFLAASVLPETSSELPNQVEDVLAQADESPNTLYYEGGLAVTSAVIRGVYALSNRNGGKPALTQEQATKFGNYFVSSKFTSSIRDASSMLSAAQALSSSSVSPAALLLDSNKPISKSNKNLVVRLTNILSGELGDFTLKVKSITDPDGTQTKKDKPMTRGADKTYFSYNLFDDIKINGVITVTLSTSSKKSTGVLDDIQLSVIVSFEVGVKGAQLSVLDKEQGVSTNTMSLDYPNTSKTAMIADDHSKLQMTFQLFNLVNSESIVVHQVFVRLSSGPKEIFFIATPDTNKVYTFELDVTEAAKEFAMTAGTYDIALIVGDFALENPFSWNVGKAELKYSSPPATADKPVATDIFKAKPVIEHMFRDPEKRPSPAVSSAFTILVLVPLAMLLLLWMLLGANISNIGAGGVWTILFHLGLGGILGLYYCFWTQLNMFQTLKYLAALAVFTFITGNRMLRNIAKARLV